MTLIALSTPSTVPLYTVPTAPAATFLPSCTLHAHTHNPSVSSAHCGLHARVLSPCPVVVLHMLSCTHLTALLCHLHCHLAHQLVVQLIEGMCGVVSIRAEVAPVLVWGSTLSSVGQSMCHVHACLCLWDAQRAAGVRTGSPWNPAA